MLDTGLALEADSPYKSWRQGSSVRSNRDHVLDLEPFDDRLHQDAATARPGAMLEIVELADEVRG